MSKVIAGRETGFVRVGRKFNCGSGLWCFSLRLGWLVHREESQCKFTYRTNIVDICWYGTRIDQNGFHHENKTIGKDAGDPTFLWETTLTTTTTHTEKSYGSATDIVMTY